MQPKIETIQSKRLVGKRLAMSLANNKTGELWKSFMPRRREITNNLTNDLFSMQVYKPTHFADFKPTNEFEKWAVVEVTDFESVPNDMETFTLSGGLYAVFNYNFLSVFTWPWFYWDAANPFGSNRWLNCCNPFGFGRICENYGSVCGYSTTYHYSKL